jgi:nucleotide-binding universal stress UspA family protein
MSPQQFERIADDQEAASRAVLERTRATLELPDAELLVVAGSPGPTLCDVATELSASVIVIGTRGRGGIRRAVLGSVSDHVVRHAPCPVVTVAAHD